MNTDAKFIVIEGLEGAGKTTAIQAVTRWLEQKSIEFVQTREPGGTPLAEQLRTLVKAQRDNEKVTAEAELLIMYASRVQLIENVIKPALAEGKWVVGDRHDLSSRAYQGGGRGISDELLNPIRSAVLQGFEPDLTLYLDIRPEVGLARASARGELDRIELEALTFFEKTRAKYQEIANASDNIITINAEQTIEEVQQSITLQLDQFFKS
ncbi:dTMP kinase [Catenovulum maritimum]|uniref:Thymidylate kinase n=1 Tax=Catenovulum maritimum TaxID=1513271 RepID=A0A0J8JJZ6_9ALTE|nr:dTMP kinase [Catenovulum maritimum]KMT64776.1 thymidylate kinase [Catenovulum maritimum]